MFKWVEVGAAPAYPWSTGLMVTMGGPKLEHLTQILTDSQWKGCKFVVCILGIFSCISIMRLEADNILILTLTMFH